MFTIANADETVTELISQLKIQHYLDLNDTKGDAAYYADEKNQQPNKAHTDRSNFSCSYCKKLGHAWKECRKLKRENDKKKKFSQSNKESYLFGSGFLYPDHQI